MPEGQLNIVGVLVFVTAIGLVPLAVVTMTGFLKISVVLFLVRNALGVQQTPPNLVLYGIALVLTVYVTSPLLGRIYGEITAQDISLQSADGISQAASAVRAPLEEHLSRFTHPAEREFFFAATSRVWPEDARAGLDQRDLVVLLPAFVASELTRAFEIGFLLYLPFLVIDLVVANILMTLGMIMVSPILISVPLKLLLFVAVDGWSRLMHGVILSYA